MRFDPLSLFVVVSIGVWQKCHGFVNTQNSKSIGRSIVVSQRTFVSKTKRYILFDDFEDWSFTEPGDAKKIPNEAASSSSSSVPSSSSSEDLYAALRARQADFKTSSSSFVNIDDYNSHDSNGDDDDEDILDEDGEGMYTSEEQYCLENWRDASCTSTVRLTLDDWIRRIAVDTYPLVVCGTSNGHLYLADLQEGEELDCAMNVHVSRSEFDDEFELPPARLQEALSHLYGQFDGGGVMALAMKDDWIVSSGREGGAHLCRITGQEQEVYKGSRGGTSKQIKLSLQRLGQFRGLKDKDEPTTNVVVTSLEFDSLGTLWMGGYDGVLRGFDYEERDDGDSPIMLRQKKPTFQVDVGSPIVNLSINKELGCGVASTVTEGLVVFSLDDGGVLARWNPLLKKVRKEFVRSAILLKDDSSDDDEASMWSVVCGGSRGSLFQRKLNVERTGFLSESHPFLDQISNDEAVFPVKMRPNHLGPVVALASPAPGLLVSGALDGSMRVWDYNSVKSSDGELEEEGDDYEDDIIALEAQYDDVPQNDSRPRCLYALSGYKVWLGSIFASCSKLVSDGADNTIIVHSFENEEEVLLSEDDDDDDNEGLSFE